ncbi:hypothetical protein PPM_0131 [Paenibacillus polymyxa M1]|nr:hypothetical protein PPM_0131 [Paenibacillus polymyxa M1]
MLPDYERIFHNYVYEKDFLFAGANIVLGMGRILYVIGRCYGNSCMILVLRS